VWQPSAAQLGQSVAQQHAGRFAIFQLDQTPEYDRCITAVYLEDVGLDRLTFDLLPLAPTAVMSLSIGAWAFRRQLR
jgi:hypothetical protein